MSKFKKFFSIIIFVAIFLMGLFMLLGRAFFHFSSKQLFLCISLMAIGFVGSVTMLFITTSKNFTKLTEEKQKENKCEEKRTETSLQETLKNFISNPFQANEQAKKIVCTYCKCKYEPGKERCPNCGAPPNF